jgi:hypothetical protein
MTIIIEESELDEAYLTHVLNPISNKKYPVYKNPSIRDIRDLSAETNAVGFVSHDSNLYVFHGGLLHHHVVGQLKIPVDSKNPDIKQAFFGRAKPNSNGSLEFSGTNQQIKDPNAIEHYHSHLKTWFK